MGDRVPSDHATIDSHRATLSRIGRTNRPCVELPAALDVSEGDVVRVSLSGTEYHARIESGLDGTLEIRGAFDNPRLARSPDAGENRFAAWVDDNDVKPGRSVEIDVVTPGYKFGVRVPGERVVYTNRDRPDDGLTSIARDLADEE